MTATVEQFAWTHGDDVMLQSPAGAIERIPVDDLLALYFTARSADSESAVFRGRAWTSTYLASAVDVAVRAGLLATCPDVDGRAMCETPLRYDQKRCDAHERQT